MAKSPLTKTKLYVDGMAQGYITINGIINGIEPWARGRIKEFDVNDGDLLLPAPTDGDIVTVGPVPAGAFLGETVGHVAIFYGGWNFVSPRDGDNLWDFTKKCMRTYYNTETIWLHTSRYIGDDNEEAAVGVAHDGSVIHRRWLDFGALPDGTPTTKTTSFSPALSLFDNAKPVFLKVSYGTQAGGAYSFNGDGTEPIGFAPIVQWQVKASDVLCTASNDQSAKSAWLEVEYQRTDGS